MSKFYKGQEVYLWHGTLENGSASFFKARVRDVYKYDGEWLYEIDCFGYTEGFILENVKEYNLSCKSVLPKDGIPIPKRTFDDLVDLFERQNLHR